MRDVNKTIRIGIIGLGVVGSSVVKVIKKNSKLIAQRTGINIQIAKASDIRNRKDLVGAAYTSKASDVVNDPDISIVVECIGGVDPAKKYILSAISNGKSVVTSNKEVIAKHGREILAAARKKGVSVLFEASVCGGIPILHALRKCLAGNSIEEISGIVNGTTNFILTKMTNDGISFDQALKQAQKLGFAEADPKMDIDGSDAAYKAVILGLVSTGCLIDPARIYKEGISGIEPIDIEYAKSIGYVIKLLAIVKIDNGRLDIRVHPTLLEKDHPLAQVSDNYNAVFVKSDAFGRGMFYGQGAGGLPTASAVVSDIIETAQDIFCCTEEKYFPDVKDIKLKDIGDIRSRYYIRLEAPDKPGVLAGISGAFAKKKVSIEEVVQRESKGGSAQIVIILHENKERDIQSALKAISKLPVVKKIRSVIRVGVN